MTSMFQFPFLQNFSPYTFSYNKLWLPGDISTIQIMPSQPALQDTLLLLVFRQPHLSRSHTQAPTSKPTASDSSLLLSSVTSARLHFGADFFFIH